MAEEKQNKNAPAAIPDPYNMAAKKAIHPKADAKNFIEIRGNKSILCCGACKEKKRGIPGAKCRSYAGQGTDHPGYGRCKFCGGASTGPKTAEGKAAVRNNGTVHGLYASVLGKREAQIFDQLQEKDVLSLEYEINMMKAKILGYLERQNKKWEKYYEQKREEKKRKYVCKNTDCEAFTIRGSTEGDPGYCIRCGERRMVIVEEWEANHTHDEAVAYADHKAKVYYSENENGGRSYYHAATIEDRALDRALNTLGRLVEKHARIKTDSSDDLLTSINTELKAASQGQVSLSWSQGQAQGRKGEE